MSEESFVVYFSHRDAGKDEHNHALCQVWTVFLDRIGALKECHGYCRAEDMDNGFTFSQRIVSEDFNTRLTGNEKISSQRLFKGFQIHSRRYLLNTKTLAARPDLNAPLLSGLEGESMPPDPILNPSPAAIGAPDWFFEEIQNV